MRLFVAVNIDERVRGAIRGAVDAFPVTSPPWRWADPSTWHVTIKFLGETRPDEVDRVVAALAPIAERSAAFDLSPGAFGAFPTLRAPRVLFYGIDAGARECGALSRGTDTALLDAIGLAPESRPFHAHVTVARIKDRLPPAVVSKLAAVPAIGNASMRVGSFELMESRLAPGGATYSVVHRFPLV